MDFKYKYRILARRDATEEWTDWNAVNDPNEIRAKLEHVERCGYEAMVEDTKLKMWEKAFDRGHLLFNPARVGETRSILHENGAASTVENYKVGSITYDGKKWYATPKGTTTLYEVNSNDCLTPGLARRYLREILNEFEEPVKPKKVKRRL